MADISISSDYFVHRYPEGNLVARFNSKEREKATDFCNECDFPANVNIEYIGESPWNPSEKTILFKTIHDNFNKFKKSHPSSSYLKRTG